MQRFYEILRLTCLLAAVAGGMGACLAAEGAPVSADELAIRAAAKDYAEAMRRGDAAKLRTMWTASGVYIDASGQTFKALDLISQLAPTGKPASAPGEGESAEPATAVSTLRFVAADVAIEDGDSGRGVAEDGAEVTSRFAAVWVKREGKWLLDSVRESDSTSSPGHPKLKPLAWLVGEWADVADDASLLTSWQWSEGGKFLVGEFLVYGRGRETVGGTQRIGWDPVSGQIKSWIFDSQGGMGEGQWRRDGDRWIVESTHVTADGYKAKAKAVYSLNESGAFILEVNSEWDSTAARPAGELLPAQRFEFRRAIPE